MIALLNLYNFVTYIYADQEYPNHLHTTLYIDNNFNDFEQQAITEAALEWATTTNNIIQYDVVRLPTDDIIDARSSIVISKQTPDHPNVLALDTTNDRTTLGFYDKRTFIRSIVLVSQRIAPEDYKTVVLHELGHSLGLEHNSGIDGMDTLMYPSRNITIDDITIKSSSDHLTLIDGIQFCKLYHCNPKELQYQKEPFHF